MIYEEFKQFLIIEDKSNPFSTLFKIDDNSFFYLEPAFYSQLQGFKERIKEDDYNKIINAMIKCVKQNKKVIFTANFDTPQTVNDDFIIREIIDITDPLKIYAEDKSRGSDYGD